MKPNIPAVRSSDESPVRIVLRHRIPTACRKRDTEAEPSDSCPLLAAAFLVGACNGEAAYEMDLQSRTAILETFGWAPRSSAASSH